MCSHQQAARPLLQQLYKAHAIWHHKHSTVQPRWLAALACREHGFQSSSMPCKCTRNTDKIQAFYPGKVQCSFCIQAPV